MGQRTVEDHPRAVGDAWMVAQPGATEGKDGHGRGLDPGMGSFHPGPAGESGVVSDDGASIGIAIAGIPREGQQPADGPSSRCVVDRECTPEEDGEWGRPPRPFENLRNWQSSVGSLDRRDPIGGGATVSEIVFARVLVPRDQKGQAGQDCRLDA